MNVIHLDYTARPQFIPFHKRKERRACMVCHRRAGKTYACIHDLVDAALRNPSPRPRYAYIAPFLSQAKAVAWDYLCSAVSPLRDLGLQINQAELRVDLYNQSQIRLFGSDNPNALRGIGLDGVVLDEYADMDPRIAAVINPTLIDRQGWAVYIGTPRGHNAFYDVWKTSQGDDEWFSYMLRADESGLLNADELDRERRRLSDNDYRQEYLCDFEASVLGSYYGKQLGTATEDGRITGVPYDRAAPVWTAWDIGYSDATAIWFAQIVGKEVHLIDYYEAEGTDPADDVACLLDKPYRYAGHILPHDAFAKLKQTGGKTFDEIVQGLGLRDTQQAPAHRLEDGIRATQLFLSRCWFDAAKCDRGLECLKMYRADFDERMKVFRTRPRHDYASHAADAFRYLAMALDNVRQTNFHKRLEYPRLSVA